MVIYMFWTEEGSGVSAHTSLAEAKSVRAKLYHKPDRPAIRRVVLPDRLTKKDACNLLMQRGFAK